MELDKSIDENKETTTIGENQIKISEVSEDVEKGNVSQEYVFTNRAVEENISQEKEWEQETINENTLEENEQDDNEVDGNLVEKSEENFFSNDQIDSTNLPKLENIVYEKLQENSLYVGYIVTGVITLVLLVVASIVIYFWEDMRPFIFYIYGLILLVMGFTGYTSYKSFKNSGYALREQDIFYKSGWLWTSVTAIPYKRIQHLEVHQGPIDRVFDLASVSIFTAGGDSSDMEIEGVLPDQAESIKAFILAKNISLSKEENDEK